MHHVGRHQVGTRTEPSRQNEALSALFATRFQSPNNVRFYHSCFAMSENDIKTLPFDWTITSSADNGGSCPGESLILGSSAAINAIAGIMSLFFGNRKVVKKTHL